MTPSRIFYGQSHVDLQATITTHGTESAYSLKLSPDGNFLAIGNDEGLLEIYAYNAPVWRRVNVYESGASIRALVWHPSQNATVFCGSANGCLHRIIVAPDGGYTVSTSVISGYIHSLQMSPDGKKLAMCHGRSLSIVNDPFRVPDELGDLDRLNVPLASDVQSLSDYKLARGIFFPSTRIIIIAFLGKGGIIAYNLDDYSSKWSIQLRDNTFLGSAAISPSGERVAVMNLSDGIDFYSTTHRRLLWTTHYILSNRNPPRNLIVDMVFVDEDTVAFGHSDGYVAFATFGVGQIAGTFALDRDHYRAPIQAIAFGLVHRKPHIFAIVPPFNPWVHTYDHAPNNIYVGLIRNNDESGIGEFEVDGTLDLFPSTEEYMSNSHATNMLQFTGLQVAMLVFLTVAATLYGQSQLGIEPRLPRIDSQATVTVTSTTSISATPDNPSSILFPGSSPTSAAQPFYAFTLSGMVTGSASLAFPPTESDGVL